MVTVEEIAVWVAYPYARALTRRMRGYSRIWPSRWTRREGRDFVRRYALRTCRGA